MVQVEQTQEWWSQTRPYSLLLEKVQRQKRHERTAKPFAITKNRATDKCFSRFSARYPENLQKYTHAHSSPREGVMKKNSWCIIQMSYRTKLDNGSARQRPNEYRKTGIMRGALIAVASTLFGKHFAHEDKKITTEYKRFTSFEQYNKFLLLDITLCRPVTVPRCITIYLGSG